MRGCHREIATFQFVVNARCLFVVLLFLVMEYAQAQAQMNSQSWNMRRRNPKFVFVHGICTAVAPSDSHGNRANDGFGM